MKITNKVVMLDCTGGSHTYLILEPELMLVDTSFPGMGEKILEEIKSLNIDSRQVKQILLTHHDVDHIGNAAFLQQATGANIWASDVDIPFILGQKNRHGIKRFITWLIKVQPPVNLHPYPEEMKIGDVTVISTPGHTLGHVSLLYQDVLFAGDLVRTRNGDIKPSSAIMTWNKPILFESIKKIGTYPFKWVCPGHGMPVERDDKWERISE